MTVAEMIERLKAWPDQEAEVLVIHDLVADEYMMEAPELADEWVDILPEQDLYTRETISYPKPRLRLQYAPKGTGRRALVLR